MTLTNELVEAIRAHALTEYPRECCGIIERGVYVPLVNIHETPETDFKLSPEVWTQRDIEAVVHSHPDAPDEPTASDMASQIETAVPWVLLTVKSGVASTPYAWGTEECTPPLVGRSFRHGPSGTDNKGDCYAIVRDWYMLERGVELPEFPRNNDWWQNGDNLYSEGFARAGFYEIAPSDVIAAGDVVLMSINSKVLNHAAVYLGNDMILHHLYGRLSRREPACLWRKMFRKVIRHESGNSPRAA